MTPEWEAFDQALLGVRRLEARVARFEAVLREIQGHDDEPRAAVKAMKALNEVE